MTDALISGGEPQRKWKEIKIPVPWGHISGKWWGPAIPQPILAIHGWQDNCGSFDRLIPMLPADLPILAIDLPGHGLSSPYPAGQFYYLFWDGVLVVRRIVKYFGFKSPLTILGHSLGGSIGFVYSALFPDDVYKLIQLDIASPTVRAASQIIQRSSEAIDRFLKYEDRGENNQPCYEMEEMINLMIDGYNGSVDRESCKILFQRGTVKSSSGDGYVFTRDVRLKVAGLGLMSQEQVMELAGNIRCRLLNIRALPRTTFDTVDNYANVLDVVRENTEVEYHEVTGTHHVHLNNPERVADIVSAFLLS